jgi:cytidine deaminase
VENASSASSLCAEQAAVAAAVAGGARRLRAVLLLTGAAAPTAPCGRCRQVLAEFGADVPIVMATTGGRSREISLGALLPHPFRR